MAKKKKCCENVAKKGYCCSGCPLSQEYGTKKKKKKKKKKKDKKKKK